MCVCMCGNGCVLLAAHATFKRCVGTVWHVIIKLHVYTEMK